MSEINQSKQAFIAERRFRVRYAETDAMGITHHASYVIWLEDARTYYCRDVGLPYNEISAQGIEMQVIDVYVKYLSPSRFDDEIVVKVWIEKVGRASCRFGYQIINETTGKLCVEAATEHAAVAHDGKIKRFFPKLYDTLITHAGTFPETYFSRKNKEKAK